MGILAPLFAPLNTSSPRVLQAVRQALLAAHRARESDDRTFLTVLHAVRDRQVRAVRALDGGGGG